MFRRARRRKLAKDRTQGSGAEQTGPFPAVRELVGARYEIQRILGSGAFGIVYQARDLRLGRAVAIKCLKPMSGQGFEDLLLEARVAAQLDHPNLATVFDVVEADDQCAVIMAYLPGGSLQNRMGAGPIAGDRILEWSQQIFGALASAHRARIVHRDVKPANVLFDANGHLQLSDFGIAVETLAAESIPAGTPNYMAPEQMISGQPVDQRADLYAAGILMFELVVGERPYDIGGVSSLSEAYDSLEVAPWRSTMAASGRLPLPYLQLVDRLTQRRPEDRPRSAAAVLRVLAQLQPRVSARVYAETTAEEEREDMFSDILRFALLDNIISPGERRDLIRRAERLRIEPGRARVIEEAIRKELDVPSLVQVATFEAEALRLLSDGDMSDSDATSLTAMATELGISEEEKFRIQDRVLLQYKLQGTEHTIAAPNTHSRD